MSGMENLEKAAMIAAVAAGLAAAEQPVKLDPVSNQAKTGKSAEMLGQRTEVEKEPGGREFVVVNGQKFFLAPLAPELKADAPKIERSGDLVLDKKDHDQEIVSADNQE
jgi:hypothetical protein